MTYNFSNASILIVEDMSPMLTLTKSLLGIFGFKNIYTALNGEKGFEVYLDKKPDIILTDWLMEPMNGMELIHKIRNDKRSPDPYVPIILMTGYSHRLRVEEARDNGATEFLVKPYTAKDLFARIEQVIEKPRQFVDANSFFGPDRRRKRSRDYDGPLKRDDDKTISDKDERKFKILQKLKESVKKT